MSEKKLKILICDDQVDECYILSKYLENFEIAEVCDFAYDGKETLEKIYKLKPDIVLLDIIMPKIDGMSVLRKLSQDNLENSPSIIVLSSVDTECITSESFNLGACFYLLKPIERKTLIDTIKMVIDISKNPGKNNKCKSRSNKDVVVTRVLSELAVPTHIVGYIYIFKAVNIIMDENYSGSLLKHVYGKIALEHCTTSECVEIAIRNAIEQTAKIRSPLFERMFLSKSCSQSGSKVKRPSNSKFLTKIKEEVCLTKF
mgnify:CR=1 FL=1